MKIDEIQSLLFQAFAKIMREEDARVTSAVITNISLRSDDRVDPIKTALEDIQIHLDRGRPSPSVISEKGAVRLFDFHGAPALCHYPFLIGQIKGLVDREGVALVGLRNTGGVHSLGAWTAELAEEGILVVFAWNGGSYTTVPYGSTEPFFGTNPISYGIPTDESPIVADMSTSQIPFMDFNRAFKSGDRLPDGSALNRAGLPTNDAREAYDPDGDDMVRMRPMGGGPKGSAIMFLLEVMTGGLVGAKMGRAATDDPFIPEEFGGFFLCVDPGALGSVTVFRSEVQQLAQDIRSSPAAEGLGSVSLPGDRAGVRAKISRSVGSIRVAEATEEMLRRMASS